MASNLTKRLVVAAVAIPVALGLVWAGGGVLAAAVAVIAAGGAVELFRLAERHGVAPLRAVGVGGAAAVPILVWGSFAAPGAGAFLQAAWPLVAAGWVLVVLLAVLAFRPVDQRPLAAAAVTCFAVLYCGALPAFLVGLREGAFGPRSWAGAWLAFFPLVVTWIGDTAAMAVGKTIGGPKLAPVVSPGKTRSGAVAGVLGGIGAAIGFHALALARFGVRLSLSQLVLFGAALGVAALLGDLVESLFKREAGVKDSSALIPGHGGVLDRFDSVYFVLPVAFGLLRAFGTL